MVKLALLYIVLLKVPNLYTLTEDLLHSPPVETALTQFLRSKGSWNHTLRTSAPKQYPSNASAQESHLQRILLHAVNYALDILLY